MGIICLGRNIGKEGDGKIDACEISRHNKGLKMVKGFWTRA